MWLFLKLIKNKKGKKRNTKIYVFVFGFSHETGGWNNTTKRFGIYTHTVMSFWKFFFLYTIYHPFQKLKQVNFEF